MTKLQNTVENQQKQITQLTNSLTQVILPIGFIYTQLPNQSSPSALFPSQKWSDITSSYAGLFFRAEGQGSSSFGSIQDGSSPTLDKVKYEDQYTINDAREANGNSEIKMVKGGWSEWIWTSDVFHGEMDPSDRYYKSYHVSNDEVRPRNQAIRIWKRIG